MLTKSKRILFCMVVLAHLGPCVYGADDSQSADLTPRNRLLALLDEEAPEPENVWAARCAVGGSVLGAMGGIATGWQKKTSLKIVPMGAAAGVSVGLFLGALVDSIEHEQQLNKYHKKHQRALEQMGVSLEDYNDALRVVFGLDYPGERVHVGRWVLVCRSICTARKSIAGWQDLAAAQKAHLRRIPTKNLLLLKENIARSDECVRELTVILSNKAKLRIEKPGQKYLAKFLKHFGDDVAKSKDQNELIFRAMRSDLDILVESDGDDESDE